MATTKGQSFTTEHRSKRLAEFGFNEIERPGSYLLLSSGDLVRVPLEALAPGHSPLITMTSMGEARVARLSDNPSTPISVLRTIAADNDLQVNF